MLAALVAACSTVDFQAPREASYADVDTSDTRLGRNLGPLRRARAPQSGFYPLFVGVDALSARLLLMERAQKTIDTQYYLVGDDPIGDLYFESLLKAADRGVRVRLLIDDIGTRSIEDKLGPLNSHRNLELRLFNPFANRGTRLFDAWDMARLNRRMHNKSLTADNEVTIMGGRNIAAEYFAANPAYNFGDIDIAAIGPVVHDTSGMFDRYWNDERSVPYGQLAPTEYGAAERDAFRARLRASIATLAGTPYGDLVRERMAHLADESGVEYHWAPYRLVYDAPGVAFSREASPDDLITAPLTNVANRAEKELLVISPYFVPRRRGSEWLTGLARRGVQVDVLTKGLAANDHIYVYGGYAPVRKPLLKEGVRFFELRGNLVFEGTRSSGATQADSKLHGKAFVVDRRYLFAGSFNWDPRSANLNTEMGVIIDSEEFSQLLTDSVYDALPRNAYEVYLAEDGDLRWRTRVAGEQRVYEKEPESGWWKRFKANLTRLLPIRGQL